MENLCGDPRGSLQFGASLLGRSSHTWSLLLFTFEFVFMFVFAHQQAEWESAGGANSDESISYSSLATALITSLYTL